MYTLLFDKLAEGFLRLKIKYCCFQFEYFTFLAPAVTVGETKGAMDSTSVFFWPLLLPITL